MNDTAEDQSQLDETLEVIEIETAKFLRSEIDKALAPLAERFGLVIRLGNGKVTDTELRFVNTTLTLKQASPVLNPLAEDPNLGYWMDRFGLTNRVYGGMTLVKYDTKKHSYPWIYVKGGKRYKTDMVTARAYFR